MLETGTAYLRLVGPTYGFFGLGLCLYFASQGAGRLLWPILAGLARLFLAVGGGWLALRLTGSLTWVFVALGAALVVYGGTLLAAVASGVWFREPAVRRSAARGGCGLQAAGMIVGAGNGAWSAGEGRPPVPPPSSRLLESEIRV